MPNAKATINGKFEIEPNVHTHTHTCDSEERFVKEKRDEEVLKNREIRNRTGNGNGKGTKLMRIP